MKTITVEIDEAGDTRIDLKGFHGQGCAKVLDEFAAGDQAKVVKNKPEFHQAEQCQTQKAGAR